MREKKACIDMLYKMILIRAFEEFVSLEKIQNKIYGMVHCCNGEEAIAVGVCSALRKNDYLISNHRPHGHAIAKGTGVERILAEMYGRKTGTNGGRGGSMHITDPENGMMLSTGIVGSGIPVACGMAFSVKYKVEDRITVVFMGDGASNEGVFYECLNMAEIWNLPIVFVVEDNEYAITTPTRSTISNKDLCGLAKVMGISAVTVDGQNVEAVSDVMDYVVSYVKAKSKPYLIHAKTIRFNEHAEGIWYQSIKDKNYRDNSLLEKCIKEKCPIKLYSKLLVARGYLSEKNYDAMWTKAKQEVKRGYQYAMNSEKPDIKCAYENILEKN